MKFIKGYLSKSYLFCIIFSLILISNFGFITIASAENLEQCQANQEVFGFTLPDYPIQHQGWAILTITVDYRLADTSPTTIQSEIYPDFVPIAEKIDKFLKNYPNETDYWEILNKKLAQSILNEYPTIGSIKIRIDVNNTLKEHYHRHSIITMTQPNHCSLFSCE